VGGTWGLVMTWLRKKVALKEAEGDGKFQKRVHMGGGATASVPQNLAPYCRVGGILSLRRGWRGEKDLKNGGRKPTFLRPGVTTAGGCTKNTARGE